MALYERITFLFVAGTFGLLLVACVLAAIGAVLTLYPESIEQTVLLVTRAGSRAGALSERARTTALHLYRLLGSVLQDRFPTHS